MKKHVLWWAILGFVAPLIWGLVGFVFFTAKESAWVDAYYWLWDVICPPSLILSPKLSTTIVTPLLNACLYGCLAFLVMSALGTRKKKQH
jgi:hypothetical protein